jgi:hypothetical protein
MSTGAAPLLDQGGDQSHVQHGQFAPLSGVQVQMQQQPSNNGYQPQMFTAEGKPVPNSATPVDPALAEKAANRFNFDASEWRDIPSLVLFFLQFLMIFILAGVYGKQDYSNTANAATGMTAARAQQLYVCSIFFMNGFYLHLPSFQ